MQQVIAGLAACQRKVEELLQSVKSSNERIEKLTDKVNALDGKVKTLSRTDLEDADKSSSGDGRAKKRKRPKSSLVLQVSILVIVMYGSVTSKHWKPMLGHTARYQSH